jgi:hypothetical protein
MSDIQEEAMAAIKNLGELEEKVRPMIRNATILSSQRKNTYVALNRLREIAQLFLATYEGNRNNLNGLYSLIKSEAKLSGDKQRGFLQKVEEVLKQALDDPTEDDVKALLSEVDTLIEQMEKKNSQPSNNRDQVNIPAAASALTRLLPPRPSASAEAQAAADAERRAEARRQPWRGLGTEEFIDRPLSPTGTRSIKDMRRDNEGLRRRMENETQEAKTESINKFSEGGANVKGKKKRRTKRGGYSWRTPSPNKSRKKTPTYKKTIKKTRTRQN